MHQHDITVVLRLMLDWPVPTFGTSHAQIIATCQSVSLAINQTLFFSYCTINLTKTPNQQRRDENKHNHGAHYCAGLKPTYTLLLD